jgi:hypothetical protein
MYHSRHPWIVPDCVDAGGGTSPVHVDEDGSAVVVVGDFVVG